MKSVSVLFVCLGNICRSPTAEGVFRQLSKSLTDTHHLTIDSAGTSAYHSGEAPDLRAQKAAKKRGYDLSSIRARPLNTNDFESFDFILVMDKENLQNSQHQARNSGNEGQLAKIQLFLDFAENYQQTEVPDPYYGGGKGFDLVIDLVEDASKGLIQALKKAAN